MVWLQGELFVALAQNKYNVWTPEFCPLVFIVENPSSWSYHEILTVEGMLVEGICAHDLQHTGHSGW
jgi:hypothetical protein